MKEASGELNMTLITIIAVAAIGGLIYVLYPTIKQTIEKKWSDASSQKVCAEYNTETGKCKTWK